MKGTDINVKTLLVSAKIRVTINLQRGQAEIELSDIEAANLISELSKSIIQVAGVMREKIIFQQTEINITRAIAEEYRQELTQLKGPKMGK